MKRSLQASASMHRFSISLRQRYHAVQIIILLDAKLTQCPGLNLPYEPMVSADQRCS